MTDRVQPGAIDSIARNDELAQIFGQFSDGWIVKPSSQPTPAAVRRPEIDETGLNGFALVSTSGFDITIDSGEGFVGGWCARDSPTTISIPANTTATVVLAWSLDAVFDPVSDQTRDLADEVRVDLARNIDPQYPSTDLFRVSTDGSGIIDTTDQRRLGPTVSADSLEVATSITGPEGKAITSLTDPIRETEEAVTFTENNITLARTDTVINSGSVELINSASSNLGPDTDRAETNVTESSGVVINPNVPITEIDVTVSSGCGLVEEVFVSDTNRNILAENNAGIVGGGKVTLSASLSRNTDFFVGVRSNGTIYTRGENSTPSFPFTNVAFDVPSSAKSIHPNDSNSISRGITSTRFGIGRIKAQSGVTSGDVVVNFGTPTDINAYDLATFQRSFDDETVTVDIIDGSSNLLFSDIGRSFDISGIDPSKNVKLQANLSRSSLSNNPTVDYLARRFTR
jgi:hypothetical protein